MEPQTQTKQGALETQTKQGAPEAQLDALVTQDINLAAYLMASGIHLLKIVPLTSHHSEFHLYPRDQELFDAWLAGTPMANAVAVINHYRHLVKDAKLEQDVRFSHILAGIRGNSGK